MQIKKKEQLNVTAEWISHLLYIQKSWVAISDTGYSDWHLCSCIGKCNNTKRIQ